MKKRVLNMLINVRLLIHLLLLMIIFVFGITSIWVITDLSYIFCLFLDLIVLWMTAKSISIAAMEVKNE